MGTLIPLVVFLTWCMSFCRAHPFKMPSGNETDHLGKGVDNNSFMPPQNSHAVNTTYVHKDCQAAYTTGGTRSGWYRISPDSKQNIDVFCEQELAGGGWTLMHESDFRPHTIENTKSPPVHKDCLEAHSQRWTRSGLFRVSPNGDREFDVYCDQLIDGGGWTVFQRRENGNVDFYRYWHEYTSGFGDIWGENFWLGNEAVHQMTREKDHTLKVELMLNGIVAYADYSVFYLENSADYYRLRISGFSGATPPGDSLAYHNSQRFSTKDNDNDIWGDNCAKSRRGGWWYRSCEVSNLNGLYGITGYEGMRWTTWDSNKPMSKTRMMIRRKSDVTL